MLGARASLPAERASAKTKPRRNLSLNSPNHFRVLAHAAGKDARAPSRARR